MTGPNGFVLVFKYEMLNLKLYHLGQLNFIILRCYVNQLAEN